MRTITITIPDQLAEALEAEAREVGQSVADLAGERFATAWNADAALRAGTGAPNTVWENGRPVYRQPEPPDWLRHQLEEHHRAAGGGDNANRLRDVVGKWPGDETDEEINLALECLS